MEEKKTLRDVPKEYFGVFANPRPVDKGQFWGMMLCYMIFLILSGGFFGEDYPIMKYSSGVIFILAGLFIFPTIYFSSEKRIRRHRRANTVWGIISMEILCLILINLITAANYFYCDAVCSFDPLVVYIIGWLTYVQHIVMMILFWKRMKKCIIGGCYLPGGTGFWTKKLLPKIMFLSAIMPVLYSIAFSINVCSIATDWGITLTEGIYPFVALFFFLIAELLAAVFAYGNAAVIGQYNYAKIYGWEPEETAEKTAESDSEEK